MNRRCCVCPVGQLWFALGVFGGCLGFNLDASALPRHAAASQKISQRQTAKQQKQSSRNATRRSSQRLKKLENLFVPPKGNAPKSTANSATRDRLKCSPREASIEAWSPPLGYGLSTLARPNIVLNLPLTAARQVALLFRNESGDVTQQAFLPIPISSIESEGAKTGLSTSATNLVSFQLPASQPGLLPGQRYHWSLVVVCGDSIEPDDPTFMGWVEYLEPTVQEANTLAELSPPEQLRWYGQRGYWYDMVRD